MFMPLILEARKLALEEAARWLVANKQLESAKIVLQLTTSTPPVEFERL
jgi:hypothetical protein